MTKTPVAVKGIIPPHIHAAIDPINVAHFTVQSMLPAFRKHRKELGFNLAFSAIAGLTVALRIGAKSKRGVESSFDFSGRKMQNHL